MEEEHLQSARDAPRAAWQHLYGMTPSDLELHFGGTHTEWKGEMQAGSSICKLLVEWTKRGPYNDVLEHGRGTDEGSLKLTSTEMINTGADELLMMEKRAQAAYRM